MLFFPFKMAMSNTYVQYLLISDTYQILAAMISCTCCPTLDENPDEWCPNGVFQHAAQQIVDKVREPTEHVSTVCSRCLWSSLVRHMGSILIENFLQLVWTSSFKVLKHQMVKVGLGSMAYGFEHPIETYFGSLALSPVPSPIFIVELAEVVVWCEQEVAQSPWGPSGPARGCLLVVGHWTSANWRGGDHHDAPCLSSSIHRCEWMWCAIYRFSFLSSFRTAVSTGTHFF